ncbi:erythrocyte membrane protein 1, PfEMP1, putative [Plasmodium sp. DRC-Itaito]|nr:erythrocyte membrane protein 1, PfEMP1, putative [Plasmodium sp. DRC-Itaito]
MAPHGGTTESAIDEQSAKHLLDSIGKIVHDKVKEEAETYKDQLKGNLQKATNTSEERVSTIRTCDLVKQYYERANGAGGDANRYPCGTGKDAKGEDVKRFSDTLGGQCTDQQIEGNDGKRGGACAPVRRLHLCDHNLENIETKEITDKNDLLGEVCLAAYYEGESLQGQHGRHHTDNYGSTICTVLARSFADIGDIIRGRDVFRGNKKEREQRDKLDKNLKDIFEKIYQQLMKDVKDGKEKNVKEEDAKARYNDTKNYYKLREDWWDANRATVWEAITCSTHTGDKYFRQTCSTPSGYLSQAQNQCRCKAFGADPPTYFDYVPQYLRWFEEWAEDFCRKKKKKLEDVKKNCRGDHDDKYCSGNGYDCTKTIYKKGKLVVGEHCTNCSVWCRLYEKWIDNEKKEFIKQREKYKNEIPVKGRKKRSIPENHEGYGKKFYDQLKDKNIDVKEFLDLLSNEDVCRKINGKEEKIDFTKNLNDNFNKNINNEGTFYHSKYCEVCPGCGVKWKDKEWKQKNKGNCDSKKHYTITNESEGNEIKVLSFGDKRLDIETKIKQICDKLNKSNSDSDKEEFYEAWKCYEHKYVKEYKNENKDSDDEDEEEDANYIKNAGGLCILKKDKNKKKLEEKEKKTKDEPEELQKLFVDFFYFWIRRFLNDSMYWRNKVGKCIDKAKAVKCNNGKCNNDCNCFLKWITRKQAEWKQIKEHFDTQEGIKEETDTDPITTLEYVLQLEDLLTNIKGGYGDAKEIQGIEEMLEKEKKREEEEKDKSVVADKELNTPIDKLLKHEEQDANTCLQKQNTCAQEDRNLARSLLPGEDGHPSEDEEDDDDEEEEEEIAQEENANDTEHTADATAPVVPPSSLPDPCTIVSDLFNDPSKFKDACDLKYNRGKNWGWYCGGNPTSSDKDGSICVPPRRRKMYVGHLEQWADQEGTQASGEAAGNESPRNGDTTTATPWSSRLRKAFIQSAAVETYFLWHKYKKEKEKPQEGVGGAVRLHDEEEDEDEKEKDPQKKLDEGKIPDEFKRRMFYTLGDYRDILFGNNTDIVDKALSERDKEAMDKIQAKITSALKENSGSDQPRPSHPFTATSRDKELCENFWTKHGPDIWKGMICALTYKENGNLAPSRDPTVYNKFFGNNNGEKQDTDGGTFTSDYGYDTVKLDEQSGGGQKSVGDAPPLTDFVERPTFFRWLEEWGEIFCRERRRRLKVLKKECMDDSGSKQKCDGYGEACNEILNENPSTFKGFEYPTCARHCRSYRKWIETKKTEYDKQYNIYEQQKKDAERNKDAQRNSHDSIFSEKLKTTFTTAVQFLQNIGSCKNINEHESDNQKIFEDKDDTFEPAKHCGPCTEFKINCEKRDCPAHTKRNCNGITAITKTNIETMGKSVDDFTMLVSDKSGSGFPSGSENCQRADIFKGIRKDEWLCHNVCDVYVCKPKNSNNGIKNQHIIQIRVLITHWLEYFLEDYNKIRKKLRPCTKNCDGSTCKYNCQQRCKCAKTWIQNKRKEWTTIKDHYLQTKPDNGDKDMTSLVRNFLEQLQSQINVTINTAIEPCTALTAFEDSRHCNADANKEKGKKRDIIDCLLEKLQNEIKTSNAKPRDKTQAQCDENPPSTPDEPDDEEDLPFEEDDKTNKQPGFCPEIQKEPVKEEGDCKAVDPSPGPEVQEEEEVKDDEKKSASDDGEKISTTENIDSPPPAGDGAPLPGPEENPTVDESSSIQPESQDPEKKEEETNDKSKKGPKAPAKPTQQKDKAPPKPKKEVAKKTTQKQPPREEEPPKLFEIPITPPLKNAMISNTIAWSVGIAFTAMSYWLLKKKTKSPVDMFRVIEIPKGEYGMPTKPSSNRYIPYSSGKHRGKRYIYIEGDTDEDKYAFMSDTTDVTSSESEYEEIDTHISGAAPKYKTLIEVVLEPSKRDTQNDIIQNDIPSNNFTEDEWNELKQNFICQYLENIQEDIPNNNIGGNIPTNTQPKNLGHNVDNNTHPTPSDNNVDQKPFIMSIHDRNLYTGEEYNYDMINSGKNDLYNGNLGSYSDNRDLYSRQNGSYSGKNDSLSGNLGSHIGNHSSYSDKNGSYSGKNGPYIGIDLINDSLNSGNHIDIYDEILKRKENELFGTQLTKNTSTYVVAKHTYSDPIDNQLNLFHKWLDRHRDMCEKWSNNKEEMLHKLKEEWNKDNNSGNIHPSDNKMLNTDVSIQIHMDDPKPINEFSNMDIYPNDSSMDNILDDMEKYNEPYYDIYEDDKPSVDDNIHVDHNNKDVPSKVQIEMDVNNHKLVKEKYPIADMWDI